MKQGYLEKVALFVLASLLDSVKRVIEAYISLKIRYESYVFKFLIVYL